MAMLSLYQYLQIKQFVHNNVVYSRQDIKQALIEFGKRLVKKDKKVSASLSSVNIKAARHNPLRLACYVTVETILGLCF